MTGALGPVMVGKGNIAPKPTRTSDEINRILEAQNIPSFTMPNNTGTESKRQNKQGRNTRKPSVRQPNPKDETEEVVTPPTKPKQLTLWDMKYLKKN